MLSMSMSLRSATRGCVYDMDREMKLRQGLQARYAYEVRSVSCIYRAFLPHSSVCFLTITTIESSLPSVSLRSIYSFSYPRGSSVREYVSWSYSSIRLTVPAHNGRSPRGCNPRHLLNPDPTYPLLSLGSWPTRLSWMVVPPSLMPYPNRRQRGAATRRRYS